MTSHRFLVPPNTKVKLKDYDPGYTGEFSHKEKVEGMLRAEIERLAVYQDMLYADNGYAILIVLQAMDAAGKDSTIKYVMSGINPQGCQVFCFKAPSAEELDHDYLWRATRALPERGRIGIFNRSYYEETLVVRVHPEILDSQQLPQEFKSKQVWEQRFEQINNFEKYLVNNGIIVLKFFLNVSKEEQKIRFLERINNPERNWKFSVSDARERVFWDDYMRSYEQVFEHTSTDHAPWHIIPADRKWYTHLAIAKIISDRLQSLNLKYPQVSEERKQQLMRAKEILEGEVD
jgi:PPK2 family polyphosphate:nucleotide phosphotransferase